MWPKSTCVFERTFCANVDVHFILFIFLLFPSSTFNDLGYVLIYYEMLATANVSISNAFSNNE